MSGYEDQIHGTPGSRVLDRPHGLHRTHRHRRPCARREWRAAAKGRKVRDVHRARATRSAGLLGQHDLRRERMPLARRWHLRLRLPRLSRRQLARLEVHDLHRARATRSTGLLGQHDRRRERMPLPCRRNVQLRLSRLPRRRAKSKGRRRERSEFHGGRERAKSMGRRRERSEFHGGRERTKSMGRRRERSGRTLIFAEAHGSSLEPPSVDPGEGLAFPRLSAHSRHESQLPIAAHIN